MPGACWAAVCEPPDILWIVTTQWRASAHGFVGDTNARTPMLDAWAARSRWYAQATTPHPFGPMARAAMLTGVPSPENGVKEYFDPLPGTARTVAHELAQSGYLTAWFGKWHLARRDPAAALVGEAQARMVVPQGERGGFAHWEGFESGFLLNDPWLQGTRLDEPMRLRGYQSDVLADWAGEWIDVMSGPTRRAAPWFAVVSLEAPHPPYGAEAAGVAAAATAAIQLADNVPAGASVRDRARRELAGYHAHITATDRAIGRLLARVGPQTHVVVTSVHGDMHGAHGLFRKGWPYEESVRIPLLVSGPGIIAGRDEAAVSLLDLAPMARAWAAGETWRCERVTAPISMPSVVALPDQCDRLWHGERSATHKRVWNTATGELWLDFDLGADPGERRNLAS